jgi:hypothetical protein
MVNDQIEIKEVVNPSMFKKFRNRLLQNEAFCLIVIPAPHQVRDKLQRESIENKEFPGFRVKTGMTKNVILQNSNLERKRRH